ncbi:sodium:solute symporter [Planomicrobium sp. CPCC 101079]|uniref:sodium:solute symporter family protein n=1 Tax=Planomicrobium sp. CPCC 101079 TaxID=2599618 RepID=UPI0011B7FA43|nr:sodium:solute symporter family protein [Planomicrobium sp. CPCC 101079]TWT01621.1 sodium:solute symporter family protein [Planomicrobium sp. CPCC 101079]
MELTFNPNLLWYVIGYGVFMIILGIFYSRKVSSSDDFILAGKSLGPVVLMGTLLATWVGSGTVTGGPNSIAYSFGIWPAVGYVVPSIIGIAIIMLISAKIRRYGKYTVSEILGMKYGPAARMLAAVIIILAYVGIVSYQYKGIGFVLHMATGVSVETGTIIGAVIIIFLATIGGLMSVAPTDAFSAFLILIGLLVALPIVISAGGGWNQIAANVPTENNGVIGSLTFLQFLGYYVPVLFLLLGDQNMYQRISASKSDKTTKIGTAGWVIGMLIATPAVAILAYASRSMFPDIDPGMALIATTSVVPTVVGGLLIAAVTAFIVTTGNSYLLSAATNVTYDIYGNFVNKNATDRQKLIFTKLLIPVLGIIAFVLTMFFPTVLAMQMYSYTVYGAGITPALLAVFLWPRVTKAGGLCSMAAGVITTLAWEFSGVPFGINSALISIPVAIGVLIIVTLVTSTQEKGKAVLN